MDSIGANQAHVGITMAMDQQGQPIIAYEDSSDALGAAENRPSHLRHEPSLGQLWRDFPLNLWHCSILNSAACGHGEVNVADYTAVAVGKSGQATIVYYEMDSYNSKNNMKCAVQRFQTLVPLVKK